MIIETINNRYTCKETRRSCVSTVDVVVDKQIMDFKERNLDSSNSSSVFVHFVDSKNIKVMFGRGSIVDCIHGIDKVIYAVDENGKLIIYPPIEFPHGECRQCGKEFKWTRMFCSSCAKKAREERGKNR